MDEKQSPNFYAVIPATVRYAKIPAGAKLLYGEIAALCNKEGYCWATNEHFAEMYSCEDRTITRWLSILRELGVIKAMMPAGGGMRRIYIVTKFYTGVDKNVVGGRQKCRQGVDKNVGHNNTINITKNDTCRVSSETLEKETSEKSKNNDEDEIYHFYLKAFGKSEKRVKLTNSRIAKITKLLKSCDKELVFEAITKTSQSSFHRGDNDRGWKADLDFIIRSYEQVERLANMEPKDKDENDFVFVGKNYETIEDEA